MQLKKIALADSRSFTPFFIDYIQRDPALQKFYHRAPKVENFKQQIQEKLSAFPQQHRDILVKVLQEQYKDLVINEAVEKNISALKNRNTFTITTGHQLNIATGPAYFIFKIVTVINICKKLKALYPDYTFVPVYWMASEDHDYDEIKSFRLYGKKYTWNTDQKGAVGRFNTQGLGDLMKELPGDTKIFREAYEKEKLREAVRHYILALFGKEGLVAVDADNKDLKSLFKNVIREDIIQNTTKTIVDRTDGELKSLGYKTQIYCRDINFFFLEDGMRDRIEKTEKGFTLVETQREFTQEQIEHLIVSSPEKFSPNVILRPLYQEVILPNLAYIGGPAEIIYWLQLKEVFARFKTPFPILMPRNFAMIMDHTLARKFEKTGLEIKDLFEEKNYIFNHWVVKNTAHDLTVGLERNTVYDIFEKLKAKAASIDQTLVPFVGAEGKRSLNSIEKIEKKLLRAEKRLHSDKLGQIEALKDALFPNGNLQERTDNFLNFYQQDPNFIQKLLDAFDPFDFTFNILYLE